ncbi:unnamed protein product, partial [Laminaria digitata]
PGKTALIQICSSAKYCAVFLIEALGKVPASLWAFLRDPNFRKVGNNISGDVKKILKDFPELEGEVANYCELRTLTSRPQSRCSLAELVNMVSGKELDKGLGGGALSDWSNPDLSADQLLYAASDAFAGQVVWRVLEERQ